VSRWGNIHIGLIRLREYGARVKQRSGDADGQDVTWLLSLFLMQDVNAQSQAERVRAAMAGSLEQQRLSVQKQAEAAGASIPWSPVTLMPEPTCDPIPMPEISKMIDASAQKNSVDANLIREVARQESGFRPCVVSIKGAQGLMQLMPETSAQFQVANPFDPQQSLDAGTKLLKTLLDKYHGDVSLALSAYNAGSGRVDKAGGVPDIPETKNYVLSILSRFAQ
jgi:soluble lytic murein transglycosylase-like protein